MVPLDEAETYLSSKGLLDQPGIVLYSGAETLVSGPVYLLGLNPGGDSATTLRQSIATARRGNNAYLDESWNPGGHFQPKGQATLQRRVQHLCRFLGLETRKVPASNLAFTRSRRLDGHHGYSDDVRLCLPVHQIFLRAIQPRMLVTFGNVQHFAHAFKISRQETKPAEHGDWKVHRGRIVIEGREVHFANIPHMSLWASDKRESVLRWAMDAIL